MTGKQITAWVAAAIGMATVVALIIGIVVRGPLIARLAGQAQADVQLRQALLDSEIARFRLLPLALGDDRDLVSLVSGTPGADAIMNAKLERLASDIGASVIYLIRKDGMTLAASNWRSPSSFLGKNYSFRPYFREALREGEGEQFALGTVSGEPGLYLARRAAGGSVIVLKLEFDRIEDQWGAANGITFVTDRLGVILVTSRPEWRFAETRRLTAEQLRSERERLGTGELRRVPFRLHEGRRLVVPGMSGDMYLASTPPDPAGWQVNLALPVRSVDAAVHTVQFAAALATLALFCIALFLRERGRQRARRTAELEDAVAERTIDLRREIEERSAAEERAAQLREGLRQANRLATLGQVTASVAHETAQPVAAIRNYAATSRKLLDMGAQEDVRSNLQAIDRLAERIGTVTAELRGFARKGSRAGGPIALVEVVDGACLLLKESLAGVSFQRPAISPDLMVFGGRVRLEQVLVNLLQNAVEALAGITAPHVAVTVDVHEDAVRMLVSDNGPGIAPEVADRLFTPFATSRAAGLGLGLVIAKDIVEDFGGTLELLPSAAGAVFAVTLRRVS